MRLRQLKTFVTISDLGSFVASADRLGMTQSAVSMQVKGLEESFETELFDRSLRPPKLTESGRLLVERAREIVLLYEGLHHDLIVDGELAGLLRLGVVPGISVNLLPQTLGILRHRHPRLRIKVENGMSSDLLRRLGQGELDATIVTEPNRLAEDLECRTIRNEPLMVVAHPDESGARDKALLSSLPYIYFNRHSLVGRIIDEGLRSRNIRPEDTMELDSMGAIMRMVSRGLGVAIVPASTITDEFKESVYRVPFGDPPLRRRVGLVKRTGDRHATTVDALYQVLREIVSGEDNDET
jgi:DNA-binding transcriptional LysR family regulator